MAGWSAGLAKPLPTPGGHANSIARTERNADGSAPGSVSALPMTADSRRWQSAPAPAEGIERLLDLLFGPAAGGELACEVGAGDQALPDPGPGGGVGAAGEPLRPGRGSGCPPPAPMGEADEGVDEGVVDCAASPKVAGGGHPPPRPSVLLLRLVFPLTTHLVLASDRPRTPPNGPTVRSTVTNCRLHPGQPTVHNTPICLRKPTWS